MNSGPRAAAGFAMLMPGVSTGGGNNAFDARINGGLQSGDEAIARRREHAAGLHEPGRHGVDLPGLPDVARHGQRSEGPDVELRARVRLVDRRARSWPSPSPAAARSTAPASSSTATTRCKAKQWGASDKPPFKQNNYGVNIGGPAKVPGLWNDKWKSYFYFDYEGYRQTGGSNQPTLSIPSLAERNGDFRDWRDASGNLIPIYDPATLRSDGNGGFIKDQFMGCDGHTPNVICADRISPDRQAVARGAAEPDERRPAEQLPGAGDPGHDSRQLRLLHGPRTTCSSGQRPLLHEHLAPAGAGQVRLDAAAVDRQRDLLGSAELVGEPVQLGPHVQRQRC